MNRYRFFIIMGALTTGALFFLVRTLPAWGQPDHIIVQGADIVSTLSLTKSDEAASLDPRVVVAGGDLSRRFEMDYPLDLLNDVTPPQVSNLTMVSAGSQSQVRWTTNEFVIGEVAWGEQPGSYPWAMVLELYEKSHHFTLTGLTPGQRYYYIIYCFDQSGNRYRSQERSFVAWNFVYLPLTLKE